jgi:hypothetical protein
MKLNNVNVYILILLLFFSSGSAVYAQARLPNPPDFEMEEEEDEEEFEETDEGEEITEIKTEENPFFAPDGLDKIVGKRITEDIWEELKGDLPCLEATNTCTRQVQDLAIRNNFAIKEVQSRIEEVQEKIDEARANNKKAVFWDQLSPFLQYYLTKDDPFSEVDRTTIQRFDPSTGRIITEQVAPPPGPLERLLGDIANPLRIINNALSLIAIPFLQNIFGGGSQQAQTRAIAIGDLQVKVAQLQRDLVELKEAVREKVALELIEADNIAKEFQISQEIARRDQQRLEIIKISYRFGEYNSESYLNQLANFDRTNATVWRNWTKMRTQIVKLQQLTSEEEE